MLNKKVLVKASAGTHGLADREWRLLMLESQVS